MMKLEQVSFILLIGMAIRKKESIILKLQFSTLRLLIKMEMLEIWISYLRSLPFDN
jgi:hypothetical protein